MVEQSVLFEILNDIRANYINGEFDKDPSFKHEIVSLDNHALLESIKYRLQHCDRKKYRFLSESGYEMPDNEFLKNHPKPDDVLRLYKIFWDFGFRPTLKAICIVWYLRRDGYSSEAEWRPVPDTGKQAIYLALNHSFLTNDVAWDQLIHGKL